MSRQLSDIIKGKWRQLAGPARVNWDELSLDELIKSAGDQDKLTRLVEARYGMTHEEAEKQVVSFFERNRTT